jgi:amino acid permease
MTQPTKIRNNKVLKTVLLAAASIGLYAALFANESLVVEYYTKGNFYAALPVMTAFLFSFVHAGFASQCLEVLGLTARKTPSTRPTVSEQKQPAIEKDKRLQLQAN